MGSPCLGAPIRSQPARVPVSAPSRKLAARAARCANQQTAPILDTLRLTPTHRRYHSIKRGPQSHPPRTRNHDPLAHLVGTPSPAADRCPD